VFLKLAGPQLVQMFIGDGAKLVRDAFDLAKEKIKEGNRKGGKSCKLRPRRRFRATFTHEHAAL
jgi:hypothetical protein